MTTRLDGVQDERARARETLSGRLQLSPPGGRARRPGAPTARELAWLPAVDALLVAGTTAVVGFGGADVAARTGATLLALAATGLYQPRLRLSALDDVPRLLVAVFAVMAAQAWLLSSVAPASPVPAMANFDWPLAVVLGVTVGRAASYALLRRARRRSPGHPVLVVGADARALRLVRAFEEDRGYGLEPVRLVAPLPDPAAVRGAPGSAPSRALREAVESLRPECVINASADVTDQDLVEVLRDCAPGCAVYATTRSRGFSAGWHGEVVQGVPLIRLWLEPTQLRRWAVKRAVDVVGAVVGLVLLAPVLGVCALAVLWEKGRRNVLFRQERVGLAGRPFTMVKFRSLTPDSQRESQVRWSIADDGGLGHVGKLLRETSLDELPQLWNVLRGDMSLVGPRPERPFFVQQFAGTYAGYLGRHQVPTGMTGWAQIHGLRGDTSIEERLQFDLDYIENWSLGLDLRIIARTFAVMCPHGKG